MSYLSVESSTSDGQPVEIYEFKQGLEIWRYTSGPESVTYLSQEFVPATIVRSEITQTNEITRASISLTFTREHEFAKLFLGFTPDIVTTLTIFRRHVTDTSNEWVAYWKGRVVAGKGDGSEVSIECESVFTSMRRAGLRARYQLNCRHTLYSISCGVNMASYKTTTVVQSSTGYTFVTTGAGLQPDGYYSGGMVVLASGASRFIVNHVGATLYLSRPFVEDISGVTLDIYPGCDRLKSTCNGKFANGLNFGGFPYIPIINPFGGTPLI